jgi:hypothetical protein
MSHNISCAKCRRGSAFRIPQESLIKTVIKYGRIRVDQLMTTHMNLIKWLLVLISILLVGGVGYAAIKYRAIIDQSSSKIANWKTYQNPKYGYEIKYPDKYFLKKFTDGQGKEHEETIELSTEDGTLIIIDIEKRGGEDKVPFRDYVIELAQSWCVADGPDGGIHCPHIVKERSFTNPYALRGHEIYLTEVRTYTSSKRVETTMRGPIFGFDISTQTRGKASGLFINLRGDKVDEAIVRTMINTLRF